MRKQQKKSLRLAETKAAGNFKLKPMLTYHSPNPSPLKNHAKSTLPVPSKWNNKAWVTDICLQHGLLSILSPLLWPAAQKKNTPFKIFLFIDNVLSHPRDFMEMYNEINVFLAANMTSFMQFGNYQCFINMSLLVLTTVFLFLPQNFRVLRIFLRHHFSIGTVINISNR